MSLSAMQSPTLPPLQDAKGIEIDTIPRMLKEIKEFLSRYTDTKILRDNQAILNLILDTIEFIGETEDVSIKLQHTLKIFKIVTELKKIDGSFKEIEKLIQEPI